MHARAALLALARDKGVRYLHESAVMDGVPIDLVVSTWLGCIFQITLPLTSAPTPTLTITPTLTQTLTLTRRAHLLHLGGRLPSRRRACPRPEPACPPP